MIVFALIGVAPALLAVKFAPGLWSILAAAGAALATTGLLVAGLRCDRELATVEGQMRQVQSAATTAETRLAALESKLRETASHDDVTGTLNRRTFLTRLDEVLQRDARLQKPMAFLLIDIEGFKKINADAGRMVGDRVLRAVGRAIQASTRGTDFVGRIGGDEFAVVLGECLDPRPAVDRVFVALHGETTGGENPLPVRVSIGTVTIDEPQAGVDPVRLFRVAEEALGSVRGGNEGRSVTRAYRAEDSRPVVAR
jgi:two-component system cell cycle response regulator